MVSTRKKQSTPRIGTLSNLSSKDTYDLLTFDFPDGYPNSQLTFTFGTIPRKITGVQKVAQVFLKCLLTSKGSDLLDPNAGTALPQFLRYSNITTDSSREIYSVITGSIRDAVEQAKYILNVPNTSRASQLESVEIRDLTIMEEGINIILKMLTRAGLEAQVAVPFSSTGLKFNTEITENV